MRVHILGICGTFMGGIAALAKAAGHQVSGSDLKESPSTDRLQKFGAQIFIGHQAGNVAGADVLVAGSAVFRDGLATILVLPLMTCSARVPVYTLVIALLFVTLSDGVRLVLPPPEPEADARRVQQGAVPRMANSKARTS